MHVSFAAVGIAFFMWDVSFSIRLTIYVQIPLCLRTYSSSVQLVCYNDVECAGGV